MLKLLKSFRRNQTGNIALITAMLAVPLMGMVGGAVDFGRLQMVRSRLQDSVDAASVGAVGNESEAMLAAAKMSGDGTISVGSTEASKLFNANMATMQDVTVSGPTTTVTKSGQTITASVTAQATMSTVFLRIMGISSLKTSGASTSANGLPVFINFYMLLDNSPSMGLGATPTDINTMQANTPASLYTSDGANCAFACHDLSGQMNTYAAAKLNNVTMRIDEVRTATQQLIVTARNTRTVGSQFNIGVYTFGVSDDAAGFYQVSAPSSDLGSASSPGAVSTAAGAIDVMTVHYQNYNSDQDTDLSGALKGADGVMSTAGSGASATNPQEVLFLVSDGVNDSNVGGTRTITPINTADCTILKNKGIKIAVLYTTYLPLPTNTFYVQKVQPFVNNISPQMQACASPGLFFEVSPTQGISQAMTALFQKVVANARITQ